jgi:hypothetical protein
MCTQQMRSWHIWGNLVSELVSNSEQGLYLQQYLYVLYMTDLLRHSYNFFSFLLIKY